MANTNEMLKAIQAVKPSGISVDAKRATCLPAGTEDPATRLPLQTASVNSAGTTPSTTRPKLSA